MPFIKQTIKTTIKNLKIKRTKLLTFGINIEEILETKTISKPMTVINTKYL